MEFEEFKRVRTLWANVCWILGADHLTFEGVMGDFRKKYPADWFRGEKGCKDITGKNNILHWKKYRSWLIYCWKKKFTLLYFREKISYSRDLGKKNSYPDWITHTPLPHNRHMVNHIGGGGRGGFDTLVNKMSSINKMAGARSSCDFQD